MEISNLKEILIDRQRKLDPNWMGSLSERKKKECEFHNRSKVTRDGTESLPDEVFNKLHGNKKFYSTVGLSRRYLEQWLEENVPDRVFLDYACGDGAQAITAAKIGSSLSIGIDISDESVKRAQEGAQREGVADRCLFIQGDAEDTGLPKNSIDVVLCSGMLHHLNLSYAFPELRRILNESGKILAIEALGYNPLINLYRKMTPQMRTDWEKDHILRIKDLKFASRFFEIGEVKFWHLTSPLGVYARPLMPFFNQIDSYILKIPGVRLMAWQFTFELLKKANDS